jgi:hypothetical protein
MQKLYLISGHVDNEGLIILHYWDFVNSLYLHMVATFTA